ncbi:MAG: outer membrane lipoprotein carrier protein LolA [Rhodothermales bacterium]
MKHKNHIASLIALFIAVLFTGQQPLSAQSEAELIGRLRAKYDQVELMKADFTQNITSPFGDLLPENRGSLLVEGDRYRVETASQTFVTDGETTWIYSALEKQVLINDFVDDETTFSISNFLDNFHSDYQVLNTSLSYLNGTRHHELQLKSEVNESFFKEVTLWMRDSDHVITRLKVLDVNDAVLDFNLNDIEINPYIEGNPFTFTPPDGAEIIDLRS